MKKRLLALLLTLAMMVGMMSATALAAERGTEDVTYPITGACGRNEGNNITWSLDANGALTFSGTGKMKSYSMANATPWYPYREQVKTVTMADTITYIGSAVGTFSGCVNLTSVTLPSAITKIPQMCFQDCSRLASITIPDTVTELDYFAFQNCAALTEMTLPAGITKLPQGCFSGCTGLQKVTFQGTITDIAAEAFAKCGFKEFTWPESVTKIPSKCFQGCAKLTSFTIPKTVTSVQTSAFENSGLTTITVPDNVTVLSASVFKGCKSLTSASVSKPTESMFQNFTALETVTIAASADALPKNLFNGCSNLTTVSIPANVNALGAGTITGCGKLNGFSGEGGSNFKFDNGSVFSSDGTTLLLANPNLSGSYTFAWYKTNPAIEGLGEVTTYAPAAGQFVVSFEPGKGMFDNLFNGYTAWNNYISIGGFGGYMDIKCDKPIVNSDKNPYGVDFMVYGNAFDYGNNGSPELAGVLVSQDGKTWYTLAGAAHYELGTKWNETATLKDGKTVPSILVARSGVDSVDEAVPTNLISFGYGDVHNCSGSASGEGVYPITGKSGNPYASDHNKNIGDSFDISWAVDENGKPVHLESIQYIRLQNVVDVNHSSFGESSPEIGGICAITNPQSKAVEVTDAPTSIKINGVEYIGKDFTKAGNTYYYEGDLNGATNVAATVTAAASSDNLYINKTRYTGSANFSETLDADGNRMIRIIAQSGTKEPVIYVFKLTGGDTTDYLLDNLYVKNTGAVFENQKRTDGTTYTLDVAANYDKVEVCPVAEKGATVTVNGAPLPDTGYQEVILNDAGASTTVTIVVTKDGASETTTLTIHRAAYSGDDNTGTAYISVEKFVLGQGYIVKPTAVTFNKGDTVADITKKLLGKGKYQSTNSQEGFYLSDVADPDRGKVSIPDYVMKAIQEADVNFDATDSDPEWLGEFDYTNTSGWMVTVNNSFINRGAGTWDVKDGDVIRWQFTVYGLGADLGNSSPESGSGGQQSLKALPNKDTLTKLMAQKDSIPDGVMKISTKLDATTDEVDAAVAMLQGNAPAPKVEVSTDEKGQVTAEITLPDGMEQAVVKIPVADGKSGNVAALVNQDGSLTILKKSVVENGAAFVLVDSSCTVKIVDNAKDFTDAKSGWFVKAVDFASSHELFKGMTDTTFGPNGPMNCAMLATVLWRLEDEQHVDTNVTFKDVVKGQYYVETIAWAAKNGIIKGYSATSVGPEDPITREQLATMLYRYAKSIGLDVTAKGDLSSFNDQAQVSDWASDAMRWAVGSGLIKGRSTSHLVPAGNATRAEVATILERMV